jgi:hypothetical protein
MAAGVQRILRPATAGLIGVVIGRQHQPGMNRPSPAKSTRERTSRWHRPQHQAPAHAGHPGWRVARRGGLGRHPATGCTARIKAAYASMPPPPAWQGRRHRADPTPQPAIVAQHIHRQAARFVDARPNQPLVMSKNLKDYVRVSVPFQTAPLRGSKNTMATLLRVLLIVCSGVASLHHAAAQSAAKISGSTTANLNVFHPFKAQIETAARVKVSEATAQVAPQ